MSFSVLKEKVDKRFEELSKHDLFEVNLDRNTLINAYLNTFEDPEERQEHNCNCCKSFLRNYGNVVAIINNKIETLWEFETEAPYAMVPKVLHNIVKNAEIKSVFLPEESRLGTDYNYQQPKEGNTEVIKWEHFYHIISCTKLYRGAKSVESAIGESNSTRQVFQRALYEITAGACESVIELIAQGSLYKGDEFKPMVKDFLKHKINYLELDQKEKELYTWSNYKHTGNIRNSSIGTLLINLSDDMDINLAVNKFEVIVAPQNYKRPKPVITKLMVEKAEKEIKALGVEKSLMRRHAVLDDIPVDKMIFVDRDIKQLSLFENLASTIFEDTNKFKKIEKVPINKFLTEVIPTAHKIELLLENKHSNKFINLLTAQYEESPTIFNWDSHISWSYPKGLTDSIEEKVKRAGGNTDGELVVSLEWFNFDDLDLHVTQPNGNKIWYSRPKDTNTGGVLDVDMNVSKLNENRYSRTPVENIVWPNKNKLLEGRYEIRVNNYTHRENIDVGFNIEVKNHGTVFNFGYSNEMKHRECINIATINYSKKEGIRIIKGTESSINRSINGLDTTKFHRVSLIMNSPNYWGENKCGHKHIFFMLDKAKVEESPRGFFNEFLKPKYLEHKRVFEVLGSKLKVPESEEQMAGLGFSTTQRNEIILKVTGSSTRIIKVII